MSILNVIIDQREGDLDVLNAELIAAARPAGEVNAIVLAGADAAQSWAGRLGELGVQKVLYRPQETTEDLFEVTDLQFIHHVVYHYSQGPVVLAHTAEGCDIAGRLAARLGSGMLANVVAINPDAASARQSIFGDKIAISSAVGGACPVFTVRPGAVDPEENPPAGAGELVPVDFVPQEAPGARVRSFTPAVKGDRPDLSQAKTVVAGGRGVGEEENFHSVLEPLADILGAAVGVTRDVVDLGHYPAQYQIGQTGVTVSPDLYIGAGISGAIQHTSGMQTAGTIVAINNDEDAPIFQIADLGVVGDLFEILPALTKEIESRR